MSPRKYAMWVLQPQGPAKAIFDQKRKRKNSLSALTPIRTKTQKKLTGLGFLSSSRAQRDISR